METINSAENALFAIWQTPSYLAPLKTARHTYTIAYWFETCISLSPSLFPSLPLARSVPVFEPWISSNLIRSSERNGKTARDNRRKDDERHKWWHKWEGCGIPLDCHKRLSNQIYSSDTRGDTVCLFTVFACGINYWWWWYNWYVPSSNRWQILLWHRNRCRQIVHVEWILGHKWSLNWINQTV